MRTSMALLVKFLLTFVMALVVFNFFLENSLSWVLLLAILATALNYLIGDLLILPAMGNISASIADGVMAAITAYVLDILVREFNTNWAALLWFGILIAIGEYFFHIYLQSDEKVAP